MALVCSVHSSLSTSRLTPAARLSGPGVTAKIRDVMLLQVLGRPEIQEHGMLLLSWIPERSLEKGGEAPTEPQVISASAKEEKTNICSLNVDLSGWMRVSSRQGWSIFLV